MLDGAGGCGANDGAQLPQDAATFRRQGRKVLSLLLPRPFVIHLH